LRGIVIMRELWIGQNDITVKNVHLTCDYIVLVEETGGSVHCERYGIKIALQESGESAEIYDITLNAERILELANLLCRNVVTPCVLMDVVADWL